MMILIRGIAAACMLALSWAHPGHAQEHDRPVAPPATQSAPSVEKNASQAADEAPVVTQHQIAIADKPLAYTATAGTLPLIDDTGKVLAKIFFVAYAKQDSAADPHRPITFAFNGGPGASSLWLHLGVGPKHVAVPKDGTALPQSTVLTDNPATWLPFTDLVFIDPVGSGYSRAAEGVDAQQFYEVVRDVDAAAAFVRRYLTHHDRWLSPKFIVGESYGTTRAAALVNRLQQANGINMNGVMLLSSVLDFQTIAFEAQNVLPYVLALPSYAATAWYHGTRSGDLASVLRKAEQWAMSDYLLALSKGETLSVTERDRIAAQLVQTIGLTREIVLERRLRIGPLNFGKHFLRSGGRMLGRFDGRVTASDSGAERTSETDPSFFLVTGPWVEALNHHLRETLQYRSELRYEYLSQDANRSWKWRTGGQGYLYVADELAEAMARDPRLRVFAAAGYYDLATPYFAQRYAFDHMQLDAGLRGHLTFVAYPSGHMIYTDPAAAMKLRNDVEQFVRCAAEQACGGS